MIPEEQLNHNLFVLGVLAAAVIPRQPSDAAGWWGIGGRLSNSFRKLLLAIVAVSLCRMFLSEDITGEASGKYQLGSDLLGVVEVTGLTFLCFLTPYVLQQGLSQFMNIVPGKSLKCPLYIAALLSFLGVSLSRMVHPNFWALKKLASAVSVPPVITTLRSYNRFTTQHSHGRGFVLAQTIMVVEYWNLAIQLCCAAAYALDRHTSGTDEETSWDRAMKAPRSIAFAADWTRVLVHATFLNQLDETYHATNVNEPFPEEPRDGDEITTLVTGTGRDR